MAMGRPFDLPYSVELWDDADSHVEELIALTGDYRVARAAFDEAVKRRPNRRDAPPKQDCSRTAEELGRALHTSPSRERRSHPMDVLGNCSQGLVNWRYPGAFGFNRVGRDVVHL
jgi:hypothetical protein